jgi:hypothetical protein
MVLISDVVRRLGLLAPLTKNSEDWAKLLEVQTLFNEEIYGVHVNLSLAGMSREGIKNLATLT